MALPELFDSINTEVLDLQAATPQTFERPLKRLHQLLNHPELVAVNDKLTSDLDFIGFMSASEKNGR